MISWTQLVAAAKMTAPFLPEPVQTITEIAAGLAALYISDGCEIDGCPAEIEAELRREKIPTGEKGLAARTRAIAHARGLG